jgi:hypothetical protein
MRELRKRGELVPLYMHEPQEIPKNASRRSCTKNKMKEFIAIEHTHGVFWCIHYPKKPSNTATVDAQFLLQR